MFSLCILISDSKPNKFVLIFFMPTNFNIALEKIRAKSSNTVEQGSAFEKLSKIYFENDDTQKQEFDKIWHYRDWAKENPNFSKTDIGIDLVGELKDNKGLAAIQCKFFKPDHQISKEDLDSFVSASSNEIFTRLILIDTSNEDLGSNAKSMINNLNKTYQRIQKYDLENTRIDWLDYIENQKVKLLNKKDPLDHQIKAVEHAKKYYTSNDRGKMIMACGTGKTYTSLKIAEEIANKKFILYMVPSLALMSQTIREWKNDCKEDFIAFSACSDKRVGRTNNDSDQIEIKLNELAIPATTDPKKLAEEISKIKKNKMIVIFSTYQSIDVVSHSQKKFKMDPFDLIICDEAHRTTGATFEDQEESYFVKIHENKYVEGKKRLYMTATLKIFGNKAKKKADEGRVELASMDDPEKFGEEFFNRGFNWAVENNLLSDYKVVILAVDESLVSSNLQKSLEDGSELKLTDATKIIGVYKALAKVGFEKKENEKLKPIKKAIAFTQSIEISKIFEKEFTNVINEYLENDKIKEDNKVDLNVEVQHIDGTFNADQRNNNLNWLKDNSEKNNCRILSNVKCLSEGVDVPSLDAIMFLHPKKSQIDVVQAVGRVMRKAQDKDLGYVIIPVTVAPGVSPEKALNDNEKYKVVWQIVNALRTHDERLDSKVNLMSLGEDVSDKIEIVTMSAEKDATTAKVEDVSKKKPKQDNKEDQVINLDDANEEKENPNGNKEEQMSFELDDLSQAIKAKIVQKCGTRDYWENWATDISKIATQHIQNLRSILVNSKSKEKKYFNNFLNEIRDDLNPEINENDVIEMIAQHIITKPVFESLFSGNKFSSENQISIALEKVIKAIYLDSENYKTDSLLKFYESVQRRSQDIITTKAKSTLINELYERFFKNAFPLTTQKLGIVYSPPEVVDFINKSSNYLLIKNFGKSFSDKNIHILDPFTGTGTFISRLISSGLIDRPNLKRKYESELHANEMVLLAYYIAGINIESVYHEIVRENKYKSFNGMVLTDTFHLYEQDRDMIAQLLPDNSNKRTLQKKRDIRVILGNPPYSAKQKSAKDDNQNIKYPNLDESIRRNFSSTSSATLKQDLYDSYIRSFFWASERIKEDGIIGFITNSGWIDREFASGMRKYFSENFNEIYILNLRGNIRKNILSKGKSREGENIFGQGSMTGICISLLVKNKNLKKNQIKYFDIGDDLSKIDKQKKLRNFGSIKYIEDNDLFINIKPNEHHEWINKGNPKFYKFDSLRKDIFKSYGPGIATNRDAWLINFNQKTITENVENLIKNYNFLLKNENKVGTKEDIISWTRSLRKDFDNKKKITFNEGKFQEIMYRPFNKQYLFNHHSLIESRGITNNFFNKKGNSRAIVISGPGSRNGFSVLATNSIVDLNMLEGGSQCFPLYSYEEDNLDEGLFASKNSQKDSRKKSLITNDFKQKISNHFKNDKISNEIIFYYIYGVLHSNEYRKLFLNNLIKEFPKIPIISKYLDFYKISKIGKELFDLHVNYEKAIKYKCELIIKPNKLNNKDLYRVEKIKIIKNKDNFDIAYNSYIELKNLPLEILDYKISGKSPIEWVIDKQMIKIDKKTNIVNDANDYANKIMNNPSYPLELIQKVITVSFETMKLVNALPKLNI